MPIFKKKRGFKTVQRDGGNRKGSKRLQGLTVLIYEQLPLPMPDRVEPTWGNYNWTGIKSEIPSFGILDWTRSEHSPQSDNHSERETASFRVGNDEESSFEDPC